jgi:hypothetical protein
MGLAWRSTVADLPRSDAYSMLDGSNAPSIDQIARLAEAFAARRTMSNNGGRHTEALAVDDGFRLSLSLLEHAFTIARRAHGLCEELQTLSSSDSEDCSCAASQRALDSLSTLLRDAGVGRADAGGSGASRVDSRTEIATHDVTMCILEHPKGPESTPHEPEAHDHAHVNGSENAAQQKGHSNAGVGPEKPRVSPVVERIARLTQRPRGAVARIFDAIWQRSSRRVRAA